MLIMRNKKQALKSGIKTILNFTFGKLVPTVLGAIEKEIPKTIEKYENHDKVTDEKLDEIYEKTDKFYDTIDKVYNASDYLNDKVNNSNFFNGEDKKDK